MAVLSVVGVLSYGTANKKSRDSRRISDLEKMRMALEMIRQVGVTYPARSSLLSPNYLQTIPVDPKGVGYSYGQSSGGYGYIILAEMEDLGSTNGNYTGSYNYRVTNP